MRKFVYENIHEYLDSVLDESYEIETVQEIAGKLERGLYNYSFKLPSGSGDLINENDDEEEINELYKHNFVGLMTNLNNSIIRERMIKDPDNFFFKKRMEIYPEKWEILYKNRTEDIVRKKGANRCPRCKTYNTSYQEIQTRSADESSTVKVSCDCGHRWIL